MRTLYLRIYITMVVVLLLFAAGSGWVFQRHLEQDRQRADLVMTERMGAWAELIQRSLPGRDMPPADQASALRDWSQRLRLPLALDSESGQRIAESESYSRRQSDGAARALVVRLEDGRTLWIMRPGMPRGGPGALRTLPPGPTGPLGSPGPPGAMGEPRPGADAIGEGPPFLPFVPLAWQRGLGLVVVLVMLFLAVAAGAYPVVRRLTRRLNGREQQGDQHADDADHDQ